ncbi:MAG: putative secreted protein [Nocardioides sp.]|nr:putative secreted protein [Nocardioides sp.]
MTARRWWLASGLLLVLALVCLTLAVRRDPVAPTTGSGVPSSTPDAATGSVPAPEPAPDRRGSRPVRISIPAIDVSARVTRLGVNADRTVEVPSDPATTGWYRYGPRPGTRGSAVILGHVDSDSGPAVFYRLRHLAPGDVVTVRAVDGSVSRFRVLRLRTYPNADFPAEQVYGPHGGRHALQLVTCGGAYDSATGYQANVVVYTSLIDS